MKRLVLWSILAAMTVLAGCSSSRLTTSWAAPQAVQQGRHFNKVLVLGLMTNRNRAAKVNMENALAQDLRSIGVNAVTATDLYGPMAFRGMKEKQVLRHLRSDDIDGVVTIALIDKNTSRNFVPGYPYFWGYYSFYAPYMWGYPYGGGYYQNSTAYSFETNLYDMHMQQNNDLKKDLPDLPNTGNLLYSAQSESVDPSSPEKLGYDFAKTIVADLRTKNILR